MTAAFRAEFLLNPMSVFAHNEVGPKQNVKINLNAFAIKSFNRNTVDQTVHGEKFVKFVLFWTTFYWILGFTLSMLLSCFYWNIDYRKSIRFYDINHYHKPRARIESWKKKHGEIWECKNIGTAKETFVGFNLKFVPVRILTIQLLFNLNTNELVMIVICLQPASWKFWEIPQIFNIYSCVNLLLWTVNDLIG